MQVGILGGGQLGMFLARAAERLGAAAHVYAADADAPARPAAHSFTCAPYEDGAALTAWGRAKQLDALTYEFENIPPAALNALGALSVAVHPPPEALAVAQDRLQEKTFCRRLGVATAPWRPLASLEDMRAAQEAFGGDAIVKTRRFGYDGKGQWALKGAADAPAQIWRALKGRAAIAEQRVPFDKEVSLICTRFADGHVQAFAPVHNVHRAHILHQSRVPAGLPPALAAEAQEIGDRMLAALDYIGTLAIEFFVCGEALLVNELAPRVHNSGHWTLDACPSSQFEQHMRAVLGLPSGTTRRTHDAVMTNLIGDEVRAWQGASPAPGEHIHIYGKREIRAGRKMGHVTRLLPRGGGAAT